MNFMAARELGIALRIESVNAKLRADDADTGTNYQLDVTSLPVLFGVIVQLVETPRWSSEFGVYGGLGVNTQVQSTVISLPIASRAGAVTTVGTAAVAGAAKLAAHYHFGAFLSLFVEGGYRLISTKKLTPSKEGTGKELFQDANHNYVPISVDVSGGFISGGIGFRF